MSTRTETRALLINAGHSITQCNINFPSHCEVSQYEGQVTLLVIDLLDPNVKCSVYLCLFIFVARYECQAAWAALRAKRPSIAPGRFSVLHPVSAQSRYMWVLDSRLTLAHSHVAVLIYMCACVRVYAYIYMNSISFQIFLYRHLILS